MDDEGVEEEAEEDGDAEDEEGDHSSKLGATPTTLKAKTSAPAKKRRDFDAEFSMEMCLDLQNSQTLLPAGWAGGGGAYDTALFSISRDTRTTTWMTDESDEKQMQNAWRKAYGVAKNKRVSLYGVVYGIPSCAAEGKSVWPICSGDTRSLLGTLILPFSL
jgi:hypothetical protein